MTSLIQHGCPCSTGCEATRRQLVASALLTRWGLHPSRSASRLSWRGRRATARPSLPPVAGLLSSHALQPTPLRSEWDYVTYFF